MRDGRAITLQMPAVSPMHTQPTIQPIPPAPSTAAQYAPDDASPHTSPGIGAASPLEEGVASISDLVSGLQRENEDLKRTITVLQEGNTSLNDFYDKTMKQYTARIMQLQDLLRAQGLQIPPLPEEAQEGDKSVPTLIGILPIRPETRQPAEDREPKLPLEDGQYIDGLVERARAQLTDAFSRAEGSYEQILVLLAEGAYKVRRRSVEEVCERLKASGVPEGETNRYKMELITDIVLQGSVNQDVLEAAQILDVRIASMSEKKADITRRKEELEKQEGTIRGILAKSGDFLAEIQGLKQREAEAADLETKLKKIDEDVKTRESALKGEREELDRERQELMMDAISVGNYFKLLRGYTARFRSMIYKEFLGYPARAENIMKEHGAKGVAVLVTNSYAAKLKQMGTLTDVVAGLEKAHVDRLRSILTRISWNERGFATGYDSQLGLYFIAPVNAEIPVLGEAEPNRMDVAYFCVVSPSNDEKMLPEGYLEKMMPVSASLTESVGLKYTSFHFLGEFLDYIQDRLKRLDRISKPSK
ncbi:MAG: hypothetical protein KKD17_06955 [Nanoarchaeota archaeon]|nr:hypothetical protein [Nanoarchaeota archaeon]